jgi:hypothetical protein
MPLNVTERVMSRRALPIASGSLIVRFVSRRRKLARYQRYRAIALLLKVFVAFDVLRCPRQLKARMRAPVTWGKLLTIHASNLMRLSMVSVVLD